MTKKPKYAVKYQLSNNPVNRWHRSIKAAIRDLKSCQRAAKIGGDTQGIYLVVDNGDTQKFFDHNGI